MLCYRSVLSCRVFADAETQADFDAPPSTNLLLSVFAEMGSFDFL